MAAETITLLHLSDPQFGRNHLFGSAGLTKADQHRDSLFARLHEDLRGLEQQQGLRPEVVVVSGDLAETGTRRELEQVFEFLEQLAGTLGLERRRVLVVPGNHDINRKLCEAYFLRCEAEDEEPRAPYWPKWEPFDTMLSRFYAAEPSVGFTIEHPWTLFELPELRLVVAGLNSTMAESHRDGDHYGRVGEEQLAWFAERLAPYETQGWLRVAVVHHNVQRAAVDDDENLRDADDLARVLGPHVNLVLHGHTHNAKLGWLRPEVPVVSTGSAAVKPGARPAEVPNQYQVLRVGPGRLERWGRRYEPDQRRWAGDTRLSDDGNAWRTEDEVRFTAVHGAFPDAVSAAGPMRGRSTADPHVEERRGDAAARERREVLRDDLLARVAVVCQLRHRDATVTEFRDHDPPYLRVSVSHEGVARVHPVGVCQRGIDRAAVDAFISGVHVNYRAVDPLVCSELVYGGDPAPQALVGDAWQRGVRLLSFLEYQGILDLRGYVARQTRRLDADPVYPPALYVPQRFTRLGGLGRDDRSGGDDLLTQVIDELAVPQGRFLLLLGDFGRGKTFLLHELARRLPERLPRLVPVLVELRALEKARGLDELVAQHLAAAGVEEIDLRAFRYLLREGRVALLFDGFDELAFRVTYDRAAEHLDTLLQAAEGRAKVVVTSRTQHFISDEQVATKLGEDVARLPGRRLLALEDFDEPQILAFLVNRFGGDQARARARFDLIRDIRDLLGLSHNPRMLGFIADLPEEDLRTARERHGQITAAALYRLLLDRWLQHEVERAQPRGAAPALSLEQRWMAVTALALRLWQSTDQSVRLSELAETTASALAGLAAEPDRGQAGGQQLDPEQVAHAVGSGTLLVRSEEGLFGFVHRSVMEWLVAAHAAERLAGGEAEPDVLAAGELSPLMADFVCDLAGRDRALAWASGVLVAEHAVELAKRNALLLFGRLGEQPRPASRLASEDLRGASLSGRDLREARLVGANLAGADLRRARLVGARLDRADLAGADLRDADLTGASLLGADLLSTRLEGCHLRRAALVGAVVDQAALASVDRWGAALPDTTIAWQLRPAATPCQALAVSPDSDLLAAGGSDGSVTLWDLASGNPVRVFHAHSGAVWAVAFSPDSHHLASAGSDGAIRLWDPATGQPTHTLHGHTRAVWAVAFSPDGHHLASASDDGAIRLWDLTNGGCLAVLVARTGGWVVLRPDGTYTLDGDITGELWWAAGLCRFEPGELDP